MSFMIAVYLLRSSAAKLATDIMPALQPFPASFSLWQTEHPIHLCTSTPSCQRCRTMSHRPPRMESLWARSRTTTTAVSSSPPRKSPKACRTRASSGRLTTQTHSHNQGESRSPLDVNFSLTPSLLNNMDASLGRFEGRISLYCLALQDIQRHCSLLQVEKYTVSYFLYYNKIVIRPSNVSMIQWLILSTAFSSKSQNVTEPPVPKRQNLCWLL